MYYIFCICQKMKNSQTGSQTVIYCAACYILLISETNNIYLKQSYICISKLLPRCYLNNE